MVSPWGPDVMVFEFDFAPGREGQESSDVWAAELFRVSIRDGAWLGSTRSIHW
jgi:hypothetical protein